MALAQRLVDEGAQVAICGRKEANLEAAQTQLGGEVLCVAAHITGQTLVADGGAGI